MTEPMYRTIRGPKGKPIAGAAAFMHLVKEGGGPTAMFARCGAIAAQQMYEEMTARNQRPAPSLRVVRRAG